MNFGKMESALQKKGTDKIQVHKFSNLGTRINQITTNARYSYRRLTKCQIVRNLR